MTVYYSIVQSCPCDDEAQESFGRLLLGRNALIKFGWKALDMLLYQHIPNAMTAIQGADWREQRRHFYQLPSSQDAVCARMAEVYSPCVNDCK